MNLSKVNKVEMPTYKVSYTPELEYLMPDKWMAKFIDLPMFEVLLQEMPKYSHCTSLQVFKVLVSLASNKEGRQRIMRLNVHSSYTRLMNCRDKELRLWVQRLALVL